MSSGPKRRGCDVCRKRHVKCDRQLPSCAQCTKAGWTCPGYASDFSFVNYSQTLPSTRKKGKDDDSDSGSQRSTASGKARNESTGNTATLSRIMPKASTSPVLSSTPTPSHAESLRQAFTGAIDKNDIAADFQVLSSIAYLRYIPSLIGEHKAMDNGAKLISLASALPPGKRDIGATSDKALVAAHSAAIKSLREALDDKSQVTSTGTLIAALLLLMYEQHCDSASMPRNFHANGLANLIRFRGPESFQDEADLAILEAAAGILCFVSMTNGDECFLADGVWKDVVLRIADGQPRRQGRMTPAQLDLVHSWSCVPGMQAAFREWTYLQAMIAADPSLRSSSSTPVLMGDGSEMVSISDYLVAHRRRMRKWWTENLPLAQDVHVGPWGSSLELVMHIIPAFEIACTDYMLATLAPFAALQEPDIEIQRPQRKQDGVHLGANAYSLPSNFIAECKQLALIMRKHREHNPDHSLFRHKEGSMSVVFAWKRTRDHQPNVVSKESMEIAKFFDWALLDEI